MIGLVAVGVIAGFLAGISPCILPVLPVVLVAGFTKPTAEPAAKPTAKAAAKPTAESADSPPGQPGQDPPTDHDQDPPPRPGLARPGLARPLAVIGGLVLSFSLLIL